MLPDSEETRMIFEEAWEGMMEEVMREEMRMEGAMAEVVYMVIWSCQEGEVRVSVAKKPAVMMVVVIVWVERAWERAVPQLGLVRSIEGIHWMFGPEGDDSGGVEERHVAQTVLVVLELYRLTSCAPRPRLAPTMRMEDMFGMGRGRTRGDRNVCGVV
jgi:hypothetical protein